MKMVNGYGSVYPLSGKRRRPYAARITLGWSPEGKQIRKIIGYGRTPAEAYNMLEDYYKHPYNLDYKNLKVCEVWEKINNQLKTSLNNQNGISEKHYISLNNAYNKHCKSLQNEKIINITKKDLQFLIDNAKNNMTNEPLGHTSKNYIKIVFSKIFDYVINEYEINIKNPTEKLNIGDNINSNKHKPITEEHIEEFWKNKNNDLIKIILILSYTGLRPNELFKTQKVKIFLDENYFITGSKTKAGKDRKIPIHHRIKPLIEYFYNRDNELPFTTIYENFTYDKFKKQFKKLMIKMNLDYTPYDGRHTFSTRMKSANANEYILKRILGHSINDLTENTYTHRSIQDLINEVEKMK